MNCKQLTISLTIAILPLAIMSPAQAFQFFLGYDANPNQGTVLPINQRPNSTAAFNAFNANLGGTGVINQGFESLPTGNINNTAVNFSGVTGTPRYTLKSTGVDVGLPVRQADGNGFTNSGTFPTEGTKGISINSANNFAINFSQALQAFSFWGTDLGDNNNTLTVQLYNAGTQVNSQLIDYLGAGAGDSSVFFYGVIGATGEVFDEVRLVSSINSTGDAIGLDQFTVGTPAQVTSTDPMTSTNAVPTPALLPGLLGMGMAAWRKRKEQTA
jgi:hypothetical protein